MKNHHIEICVNLLDEGTPTLKWVPAEVVGEQLYKILPDKSYSPALESWEFLPGAIVKCNVQAGQDGTEFLLAYEQAKSPPYASDIYIKFITPDQQEVQVRKAVSLGRHVYRVLPDTGYSGRNGEWEFPQGAVVRCENGYPNWGVEGLVAVEALEAGKQPIDSTNLHHL